jgi:hypothetical protein
MGYVSVADTAAGSGATAASAWLEATAPTAPATGLGAAPAAGLEVLLSLLALTRGAIIMVLVIRIYIGHGIIVVVSIRFLEKIRSRRIIGIIVIIRLIERWIGAIAVVSFPGTTCQNKGQPHR